MSGAWIQTYSGVAFDLEDPQPDMVKPIDIAHALAHLCRFGGHCRAFYSVAEHSMLVQDETPPVDWQITRTALLHDATEAYVGDMVKPLKDLLPGFREVEDRVWGAVVERFNLNKEMPKIVKRADRAVLAAERQQVMTECERPWVIPGEVARVVIRFLSPDVARAEMLSRIHELEMK